mgnify:CR=1 FL=1
MSSTILVVEDEGRLAEILEEYLRREGFRTERARDGLRALFDDLGLPNPLDERLAAWAAFLTARVERTEPIAYLRRALDRAFSYHAYATDEARPSEVDDLATRAAEVAHATTLFGYRDRLRPVACYAAYDLPDDPALADIARALGACRERLERLADYLGNEAGLLSEVLEPAELRDSIGQEARTMAALYACKTDPAASD